MQEILIAIVVGIIVGYLNIVNFTWGKWLNHAATAALLLMLFCLGAKIGCDSELMGKLLQIGGKSVIIAVSVILGSIFCLWIVTKIFRKTILMIDEDKE